MIFEPRAMAHADAYKLAIGSVLPRPIAFVSTLGPDGVPNLAPFSFFTVICANPLTICFAPMRKGPHARKKDTLVNIEARGEFVVNVVDEAFVEAMNACSTEFPPEVDEFEACGLTPAPCEAIAPPRVAESPIAMECRLSQVIEVSALPGGGSLVIGEVVRMHVRDDLLAGTRIVTDRWHPIGRMAGATYARVTDTFDLVRPIAPPAAPRPS